ESRWEFYGRSTDNEDYKFGYYDSKAQLLDSIAFLAPYYLIVKSSGNNRSENGPAVGQPYWRYNSSGVMASAGQRPSGMSSNDGYDIISTYGNAKNILTVGAVSGLAYGYNKTEDVLMSSFSSFGPTDDGRIKPDVVADGVDVLSPVATTNSSYSAFSGTSMASPNTTGSLLLLQQYYSQLHAGSFMRSATLKGLTIHTADEAGDTPGPDYKFGWGLVNVGKAAEVIRSNNTGTHQIHENVLNNGGNFSTTVIASGNGPLTVTIAWTDPKASVETSNVLNNPAKKLVNDLDVRITRGATTYRPWILNPSVPAAAATTGDNLLDNVERINIYDAVPGESYTITVTHKGSLERGTQAYSMIVSGVGGTAYCTSAASSNAGSRIENFSFGSINNTNPAGCTTYNNFTNLSTTVEPGQSIPFSVTVGSCDATSNPKIVKIFVDFNNNGNFTDAGELVATSNAITTGAFTGNIVIPSVALAGNTSIMRVVVQETSNAANVNPCGSYANGETHDYRISYKSASNDLSMNDLVAPVSGACPNPAQQVTVRIRNSGNVTKTNVPLTVQIKDGTTTVATLNATYPGAIEPSGVATYTFPSTFNSVGGTNYSFKVFSGDATDQNRSNDTINTTVTISELLQAPTAAGVVCGNTAILKVSNPNPSGNYFWYTSPTGNASFATGANATTNNIPANNTFYVGTGARGNVGPMNNAQWGQGGGYLSGSANYIKYTSSVPIILETAKLYTKTSGKIDFIVADILSTSGTGYTYAAISTTTIDVYATSPNQGAGTQNGFDPADNGADFYLNLFLPAGSHAIIIRPQGNANLFRNNNVTGDPYPFSLGNLISFTGNSASSATDPNYFQSFYYYMYNMKVRTAD
ncbi:MAG TPA: S8 family serine peptidase, partial [Flavisolibacter sp.]